VHNLQASRVHFDRDSHIRSNPLHDDRSRKETGMALNDPRVDELYHQLRLARGDCDRSEIRIYHISQLISEILGSSPVAVPALVANRLLIEDRLDGKTWVKFDERAPFPLRTQLADLLFYLSGADPAKDGLTSFVSREKILSHLEQISGKKYRPPFVNNLVFQLKAVLQEHDPRILIVTDRKRGARLLLKAGGLTRSSIASGQPLQIGPAQRKSPKSMTPGTKIDLPRHSGTVGSEAVCL